MVVQAANLDGSDRCGVADGLEQARLLTTDAVDGDVTLGERIGGGRDISVDAGDELNVNADVMATGANDTIDLLANTALTMAAGTTASTNNGDAQISGGTDVALAA